MKKCMVLLLLLLSSCYAVPVLSHDHYTHWKTKEGWSCCNHTDCSPADEVRMEGNQLYAKWRGEWYKVPKEDIREYDSPDGLNHICVAGGRVLCFVWGAGG